MMVKSWSTLLYINFVSFSKLSLCLNSFIRLFRYFLSSPLCIFKCVLKLLFCMIYICLHFIIPDHSPLCRDSRSTHCTDPASRDVWEGCHQHDVTIRMAIGSYDHDLDNSDNFVGPSKMPSFGSVQSIVFCVFLRGHQWWMVRPMWEICRHSDRAT